MRIKHCVGTRKSKSSISLELKIHLDLIKNNISFKLRKKNHIFQSLLLLVKWFCSLIEMFFQVDESYKIAPKNFLFKYLKSIIEINF